MGVWRIMKINSKYIQPIKKYDVFWPSGVFKDPKYS